MLEIQDLSFAYDNNQVLEHFSLSLEDGEILAVMGASGGGKSTLLNLIAGLRPVKSGTIACDAKKISYVFQEPRLFPWLTVAENLRAVCNKELPEEKLDQVLVLLELEDAKSLYPAALSGGMKSRVSLARALLFDGELFLLDEPFAALDEGLRRRLIPILRAHIKERGASAILVTHQSEDAELLADRVIRLT